MMASPQGAPDSHRAFGEAVAILAGDAMLTLAFEVVAPQTPASPGRRSAAPGARGRLRHGGMIGGQMLDL